MSDRVGICDIDFVRTPGLLKKAALVFDRMAIYNSAYKERETVRAELQWLIDEGFALDLSKPISNENGAVFNHRGIIVGEALVEIAGDAWSGISLLDFALRSAAHYIRKELEWDTAVVGLEGRAKPIGMPPGDQRALEIVIKALPEPDELTDWQDILAWRRDDEAQQKLRRLRRWMNGVASGSLDLKYLEDELAYLIDEYRSHMKYHRIKVNNGLAKTVFVTAADVAGKLASFKWGEAAKALFAVRERRVALMEAERTAPGREIAYLVDARERFEP